MAAITVAILILAVVAAIRSGVTLDSISWAPLLWVFVISLASPALAAMEYRLGLQMASGETDWLTAVQISLYGSIANVLPLPAGFAIRLKAMTEQGARVKKALGASTLIALAWLTVSLLLLALAVSPIVRAASLIAAGVLAIGTGTLFVAGKYPFRFVLPLGLLEALFAISAAARFYLVMLGLGIDVTPIQAMALSASGAISSTIGLVPGALGIFEGISAAIASLAGLAAGAGLLASVVLRITGMLAILAWVPALRVRPVVEPSTGPDS